MRGTLSSLRPPMRMVPIWVSEPIGLASPLRMARQPAMKVVPTAPMPGSRTPSRPVAGAVSTGVSLVTEGSGGEGMWGRPPPSGDPGAARRFTLGRDAAGPAVVTAGRRPTRGLPANRPDGLVSASTTVDGLVDPAATRPGTAADPHPL